jgi:hypothetical protein
VTVKVDEVQMDRVVSILDDEGEIDLGTGGRDQPSTGSALPIGAAASTTTGLTTDLMPIPFSESDDEHTLHVEVEDERLRRPTGTDPDRL